MWNIIFAGCILVIFVWIVFMVIMGTNVNLPMLIVECVITAILIGFSVVLVLHIRKAEVNGERTEIREDLLEVPGDEHNLEETPRAIGNEIEDNTLNQTDMSSQPETEDREGIESNTNEDGQGEVDTQPTTPDPNVMDNQTVLERQADVMDQSVDDDDQE